VWRPVMHPYADAPEQGIQAYCYSFDEVFAEKLRALGERTRSRDLYDVVNLHRNRDYDPQPARVREILAEKCAFKQIAMITLEIVQAARDTVIGTWQGMLAHQLPELPPFEAFWAELPEVFAWLQSMAARPVLAPAPIEPEAEVLRPRIGGFGSLMPNASIMERVRFAAQNRLLVEIDYTRLDGAPRTQSIEPYSLRRSSAGDVSLEGFDVAAGHIKKYRIERIHDARILQQTFTPRFEIELGPHAVALPTASRRTASPARFHASTPRPRPPRRFPQPLRTGHGLTHVIQCLYCQKKFRRSTHDTRLNPHKMSAGGNCPGRVGMLVDTTW